MGPNYAKRCQFLGKLMYVLYYITCKTDLLIECSLNFCHQFGKLEQIISLFITCISVFDIYILEYIEKNLKVSESLSTI